MAHSLVMKNEMVKTDRLVDLQTDIIFVFWVRSTKMSDRWYQFFFEGKNLEKNVMSFQILNHI